MMANKKKNKVKKIPQEAGVNEFIKRLQTKGVDEGRTRADEIIKEAEEKAAKTLEEAETNANNLISKAKAESSKLEKAAKDSIKIAFRDSILELKNTAEKSFVQELQKMVRKEVSNKETIKDMILKVVENSSSKGSNDILVADPVRDGNTIEASVYGITQAMVKDNIILKNFASPDQKGIIIRETKKGIEIDLTDKAISDLLLENLLPVYQNLLAGDK